MIGFYFSFFVSILFELFIGVSWQSSELSEFIVEFIKILIIICVKLMFYKGFTYYKRVVRRVFVIHIIIFS